MAVDYEKAGVSLEAGYDVVRRIRKHVDSTKRLGVMGNIGSFGGMFDLSALDIKEPVLVSGTDGVGTKLKLAFAMDKHDTIGIDAVAMCVNDVLAQGAEPLVFLDYVAQGKTRPEVVEAIVAGVAEGCRQAGCALVGGETAEMPGMYAEGEYDIAGYTTGVVEKSKLIDGTKVKVGDVLVGIASTGVHSNGFSLVRKIFSDNSLDLFKVFPELDPVQPLGTAMSTGWPISPEAASMKTSHASFSKARASKSKKAHGPSSRSSASSRSTGISLTGRCSISSIWVSEWCWRWTRPRLARPSESLPRTATRPPSSAA